MKIILSVSIAFLFIAFYTMVNPLANTKWQVFSFYNAPNKTLTLNNFQYPEPCILSFEKQKLKVNTCNGFQMSYTTHGNSITFSDGPSGLQTRFCGNGFSNTVEEFIAFKYNHPITFIIKQDSLFIKDGDSSVLSCAKIK